MSVIETNPKAVLNQPPPLRGYNMYEANVPLVEAVKREGAEWAHERCVATGDDLNGELDELGRLANENPPKLKTHDRYGNRIDEVEFHPAWHELMTRAIASAAHSLPWIESRPGAHTARAAMSLVPSGIEPGHGCPISMTYAAVPVLRRQPELADEWEPRVTSLEYDPRMMPADEKRGSIIGMAMTEKQGGSDVRSNITRARPLNGGGAGAEYAITGHKWFCSVPQSDAFLVLAQTDAGVSCFLLPRWTPDGERNAFHIQRLKDKLGNRSNASSEVEFDGAWARLIGDEGRGVPTIIEMVNYTRLDCVLGSTGLMRRAVAEATHHTAHRAAFGKLLAEQPLMQNVLADLCIESEAATVTAMRLARACDEAPDDPEQNSFKRLALAVSKYWICKSATWHVGEALECFGGAGYIEESPMPRLYREAPLNSIWEGSGNVNALDTLRAMVKTPESVAAFFREVELASGANAHLDAHVGELKQQLGDMDDIEYRARGIVEKMALALQGSLLVRHFFAEVESASGANHQLDSFVTEIKDELQDLDDIEFRARGLVERMGLALQASLLVRHSPPEVSDAFCASRLGGQHGRALGTLPAGVDCEAIVERHRPHLH